LALSPSRSMHGGRTAARRGVSAPGGGSVIRSQAVRRGARPVARLATGRVRDVRAGTARDRPAGRSLSVRGEGALEARLVCGEHAEVVGELRRVVTADGLSELPRRLLMLALYRCGRHVEALDAYRDARAPLDEIGLRPGPELRQLESAILRHDTSLHRPAPAAAVGEPQTSRALPGATRRKLMTTLCCDVAVDYQELDLEGPVSGHLTACARWARTDGVHRAEDPTCVPVGVPPRGGADAARRPDAARAGREPGRLADAQELAAPGPAGIATNATTA